MTSWICRNCLDRLNSVVWMHQGPLFCPQEKNIYPNRMCSTHGTFQSKTCDAQLCFGFYCFNRFQAHQCDTVFGLLHPYLKILLDLHQASFNWSRLQPSMPTSWTQKGSGNQQQSKITAFEKQETIKNVDFCDSVSKGVLCSC